MSKESNELPDDIEVIGPGQMLAEAREAMGLSQDDVASKLNFRTSLVDEIENEQFDKSLPDTFNRGYLKNYAKLVGVLEQDVLSSYEMLGVAAKQRTEMHSFSKITEKQAQHSRLMWVSYLILAALIASSVLYYLQDAKNNATQVVPVPELTSESGASVEGDAADETSTETTLPSTDNLPAPLQEVELQNSLAEKQASATEQVLDEALKQAPEPIIEQVSAPISEQAVEQNVSNDTAVNKLARNIADSAVDEPNTELLAATAIFSFAGDCWVNIYDGNGERIAWGIKKAGYVMELNGVAPFKVTVGKPELVTIDFNGESVDMSAYNVGNIAKFTLPESS